jgi:3-oxoacyl-[acyl-carrier protein] reductase
MTRGTMNLDGKTALVTGASRNIGRAVAETLAEAGADVGITAHSNREGCEETAHRVESNGGTAAVAMGDISDTQQIEQIVESVRSELGPLDVLVNNASIRPKQPFLEVTPEEWDRVHSVNLRGMFFTAQEVIPDMLSSDGGSIINVLGVTAYYGNRGKAHVYASKTGSIGMLRSLATEFGSEGIRVNGVSPGAIDTERDLSNYPDDELSQVVEAIPLGRLGDPEEVADVCCFLASDRSSFMTGQVLHVNGGLFPSGNLYG